MSFLMTNVIHKKRFAKRLSDDEIFSVVNRFSAGEIPDYQMAALLMAICINGMDTEEMVSLTRAMRDSGEVLPLQKVAGFKVDKHSTGGVGDKTTLIIVPLMALTDCVMPSIAGRGLGHTGGTVDKLQSIPGFTLPRNSEKVLEHLERYRAVFMAQTEEICPADRKMYQLRDVTSTVESLPLIVASILSKKLAESLDGLVLDVKVGSGAFMKTAESGRALAKALVQTARSFGLKTKAFLTDMNQPLGRFVGNSLEVMECLAIMKGERAENSRGIDMYEDTRDLSLKLAAEMHHLSGKSASVKESRTLMEDLLTRGEVLQKFEQLVRGQNGSLANLPVPNFKLDVLAEEAGFVGGIDTERVGQIGILLKAGRQKITDQIVPTSGIEMHVKIGQAIQPKDPLFTLHGDEKDLLNGLGPSIRACLKIALQKPKTPALIIEEIS